DSPGEGPRWPHDGRLHRQGSGHRVGGVPRAAVIRRRRLIDPAELEPPSMTSPGGPSAGDFSFEAWAASARRPLLAQNGAGSGRGGLRYMRLVPGRAPAGGGIIVVTQRVPEGSQPATNATMRPIVSSSVKNGAWPWSGTTTA